MTTEHAINYRDNYEEIHLMCQCKASYDNSDKVELINASMNLLISLNVQDESVF